MKTGTYISGAAHILLIGWLLFGNVFRSQAPEPTITDVSVISAAQYNALIASDVPPDATVDVAAMPDAPTEDQVQDITPPTADVAPTMTEVSDPSTPTDQGTPPDLSAVQTLPDAQVSFDTPTMAPPSVEAGPDVKIDDSTTPTPRKAPRVAPVPFLRPETDVAVSDTVTQAASDQVAPDVVPVDTQDAAPQEATTKIVTEADKPAGAPTSVPVPRLRPQPPQDTPTPTPDVPTPPAPDANALAAALAEAQNTPATVPSQSTQQATVPMGPPMTLGEKESLRVAVSTCWNTGSLSSAALRVTVVVGVQMTEAAKPISGSIQLVSSTGGSGDAVTQAFEAARRAILRCGAKGYDLPQEKFGQWRDIEMTFNPEKMRIK